MRLKVIACDVLARPVYLSAATSPHVIDLTLQPYGLHLEPHKLREKLQAQIDSVPSDAGYDAVVMAYGLCGKAADGLRAGVVPLVIPRAHDCITLFLGNRARYDHEFNACPGTYWYVKDFIERSEVGDVPLSIGAYTAAEQDTLYAEYVEKYGADNADYLMEILHTWQEHYERAAFIDLGIGDSSSAAELARTDAGRHGWRFEQLAGDMVLIKRLLDGDWKKEDFLVLQPGQRVEMIGGNEIISAR